MSRPSVISCSVFGGRSPLTGKPVGERHRWGGGAWGKGSCDFCGRYLDDVLEKPAKCEISLDQAIKRGELQGDSNLAEKDFDWRAYALGKPQPKTR